MSKLREFFRSPHIQIALATGISIIALAFVSKRLLAEPMHNLIIALPPFIALTFETLLGRYKDSKICTTWYWVTAVLGATAVIIFFYLI
ncbi:MAG: hypothetical protein DWQ05_13905 [Calditrichaeota bacterium]|nr:MAG: hypothetical protein DWQ05_13905 [Calditrichota bacterium]